MALVTRQSFWQNESKSLLLQRNNGFVTEANAAKRCEEFKDFLKFIPEPAKYHAVATAEPSPTDNDEMNRIFREDAVRTFSSEDCRSAEVNALYDIYRYTHDYHQGLGFVIAFLILFLDCPDAVTIACYLNDTAAAGYYKILNEDYLRDARVFEELLLMKDPQLGSHMQNFTVPGQYLSKWFIGLCIHVFPFEAIHFWLSKLLRTPTRIMQFKLALSIMEATRERLLKMLNTAEIIQLLKFDFAKYPDKMNRGGTNLYMYIVDNVENIDLDSGKIDAITEKVEAAIADENERRRLALERQMLEDLSDDFSDEDFDYSSRSDDSHGNN